MSERLPVHRMRIFAGPNGSGKSTVISEIQTKVRTGPYVNADEIEKTCRLHKFVNLSDFSLISTKEHFESYLQRSTLLAKAKKEGYIIDLSFSDNVIVTGRNTNSYEAALIAAYLRDLMITKRETFSFETVMSHPSKLETLKKSASAGFKNYLYFVSTADPSINIERVADRVLKGGHNVPSDKIKERYFRSLELLIEMIPYCHRCFVFDNSGTRFQLIVEVVDGEQIIVHTGDPIPGWIEAYLLKPMTGDNN
ncbi:toxin [Filimonas effusa]|uniref:Toxin n=1 Tax=Filimonas effusa TaxID=2508721 RepID=A0A4Q1D567_9BACT|nr:toxin [Filimonas effusa]RXK83630.1 toxin [Filimonas effusa]